MTVRRTQILYTVISWWRDRLDDECPVSNHTELHESFDYKGEGPWYIRIALNALYRDYLEHMDHAAISGDKPQVSEFAFAFRRICPVLTKAKRRGTLTMTSGQVIRSNRTFLDIPDRDTCWRYYRDRIIDIVAEK